MPSPTTTEAFVEVVRQAELIEKKRLETYVGTLGEDGLAKPPRELAEKLVKDGYLTKYQSVLLLKGRSDCFRIGPYRILERLGFGAMANVYLCEHQATQGFVAVKVMTGVKAEDPVALKRFYREARASAKLDHKNIVRVRDIDWHNEDHYMVMDFVDGSSVQDIIKQFGPMDVARACHYISQAAEGLQYAHKGELVHRDIKPGNLLIDREGTVKILDMGLARFLKEDGEGLTAGEVLGSPEYFAPEQAIDSHNVDIRADIYALGAIFYYMLAGVPPYNEERSPAGKVLAKEKRPPKPVQDFNQAVPEKLTAVLAKMMATKAKDRYQIPQEIVDALAPWTGEPIPPPPDKEMPQLSRGALKREATDEKRPLPTKKKKKKVEEVERGEDEWSPLQVAIVVVAGCAIVAVAWALFGGRRW